MAGPQQQTTRTTPTPAPAREGAPPDAGALQDPLLALQDAGGGGNGAVNDKLAAGRAAPPAEPPSALQADGADDTGPGWTEWLQDLVGSEEGAVTYGPAGRSHETGTTTHSTTDGDPSTEVDTRTSTLGLGTSSESTTRGWTTEAAQGTAATDTIGATTTETDAVDWNPIDDGSIGTSATKKTTTEHIGSASSVREEKQSDALKLGDGAAFTRTLASSDTHKDADGAYVDSAESSGTAGVVWTESGEVGAKAGASTKQTRGERTTEAGGNLQVTNNGAKVDGTLGAARKAKSGLTTGVKTSATGNFSVEVKAIGDDRYQLVTTISGGGSLELSAGSEQQSKEHGAGGSASGAVSGGISGSFVMTNTMSAAEATAYLADLEASESGVAASRSKPEFGILAKLAMLGDEELGGLALVDPTAAKNLGEGDGVTMTLSANAGLKGQAGGTVGAVGASVKAGATEQGSITYAIKRVTGADGQPRIEIAASFSQNSAQEIGASGSYLSAELGGTAGRSAGSGHSATFLLDPDHVDYDTVYAKIMGATSESELKALDGDAQVMALRASATASRSEGSTAETTAGLGFVKAGMKSASESSQVVSEGPAGVSATFTETDTYTGRLGVPGVEVSEVASSQVTGSVDVTGDSAFRVTDRRAKTGVDVGTDVGMGVSELIKKSPRDNLQALLTETATRLSAYDLDTGQFDQFLARARDRENWARCAHSAGSEVAAWEALRVTLVSEQPVREFADVDLDQAIALGQMQAVVQFAGRGEAARVVLRQAIFHWTQGLHHPVGAAEDIASLTEFPPSMVGEAPGYHAIAGEMAQLDAKLAHQNADSADATTWLADLTARVNALYRRVEGNTDFANPRAKMEMLDALTTWQDRLAVAREGSVQDADTCATDPAEAMAEMHRLEEMVRAYKGEEHALFERIRSYMSDEQEDWLGSLSATVRVMSAGPTEPGASFALMAELYESWISTIKDLRGAYVAAGITDGWLVSRAKGEPREDDEPNSALLDRLWRQYWAKQSNIYHIGETLPRSQYDMYKDY